MRASGDKIKKISVSDQVTERIKEAIQNGKWKPHEKMPSESELADLYGVNRLTVRMALQKLNTIGIIETRVGDGSYVIPFSLGNHIQGISEFFTTPELLDDVCEFRKVVEIECARLAIEAATESELDELKKRCDRYEELEPIYAKSAHACAEEKESIIKELAQLDLDIHSYICQISHNTLFSYSFTVAREPIYQFLCVILKQRLDRWLEEGDNYPIGLHSDIYRTIKNKDFDNCKKLYTKMVDHNIIFHHD